MKQSIIVSYTGRKQDELIYTSRMDQFRISQIDNEEVDVKVQLSFTAPKNVLNRYMKVTINNVEVTLGIEGDFRTETQTLMMISKQLNAEYDIDFLVNRAKVLLIFSQEVIFQCNDYYLCKILGCIKGKQYQSQLVQDLQKHKLSFEKKVFMNISKVLNVISYDMRQSNYYEQKNERYILLKTPYSFTPGSLVQVTADFNVQFSVDQLMTGIKVRLQDENFNDLFLEDDYTIDLYIQSSQKMILKRQIQQDERQRYDEQLKAQLQIDEQLQFEKDMKQREIDVQNYKNANDNLKQVVDRKKIQLQNLTKDLPENYPFKQQEKEIQQLIDQQEEQIIEINDQAVDQLISPLQAYKKIYNILMKQDKVLEKRVKESNDPRTKQQIQISKLYNDNQKQLVDRFLQTTQLDLNQSVQNQFNKFKSYHYINNVEQNEKILREGIMDLYARYPQYSWYLDQEQPKILQSTQSIEQRINKFYELQQYLIELVQQEEQNKKQAQKDIQYVQKEVTKNVVTFIEEQLKEHSQSQNFDDLDTEFKPRSRKLSRQNSNGQL